MDNTGTDTPIRQKIFNVFHYDLDEENKEITTTDTVQGFLGITSEFIAVTDDFGRVIYYMPSHRVKKIVATGDAPEVITAPSGPVN